MAKDCNVGVKGIVRVGDECLLLKKETYWDIPGGRIDGNETLEETLSRELHEELPGIGKYIIRDLVGAYRLSSNIQGDKALVLVFYYVEAEPFEVSLSSEHVGYQWVKKEDLPRLLTSDLAMERGYYEAVKKAFEMR